MLSEFEWTFYVLGKRRGVTNACICLGTQSQPLLQNRLMYVYET